MHGATRDARPHFHLLHVKDLSPIRFERVCQQEGAVVSWSDIVKGYEYQKGKFVMLTNDDFEAAALKKSETIDILHFVNAHEIDARFFEMPYYLIPGKSGERPYALLRDALQKSGKVGIAHIILRDNQHVAALNVQGDALLLTMMRFANELTDIPRFSHAGTSVRRQELDMATSLIDSLSAPWSPEQYTDEHRANLIRIIKAKIKGRKPTLEPGREQHRKAEVVDLMSRLRQSLEAEKRVDRDKLRRKKAKTSKAARRVA